MTNFSKIMFATCVLCLPVPVLAGDVGADDGGYVGPIVVDPEPIVVTAGRGEQPLSEVGQSISVITAQDIARQQSVAVTDLLRRTPGITITGNGGIGTFAAVNIRGAESDQTVALIDGVKINDPSTPGGGFNFGNLLTGTIERIEVVRGAQSVLWGSQAIGGVVNIITAEAGEQPAFNGSASYGWRDTVRLAGNASATIGPVAASVGGGWLRTDGLSAFNEARGGTERDGYRNYGGNAKVRVTLSDALSVDLRGWYSDGRTAQDGFAPPTFTFGDTPEFSTTREFVGYAGLNAALLDGRWRNRFAYALTNTRRRNVDLSGGAELETFTARGRNERFEYQGNFDVSDALSATFGAETEQSSFRTASFGTAATPADVRLDSYYTQLSVSPAYGLSLVGGVRRDEHDSFGGKTSFAANAVYSPNEGRTRLRASFGEGFKTPSLFQLFSDFGNQTLNPETAQSWDAGVTQQWLDGRAEVGVTVFRRTARNQIIFISCPVQTGICANRPFGTYDNVARTRAEGVEASIALRPVDALQVRLNYSYIDAKDRTTGLTLIRRPKHSVHASVDYDWGFGLSTGAGITHVSGSFDTDFDSSFNTIRVPLEGYVLVDLRAAYAISDGLELFGRVENLFDDRYETTLRFGTQRRAAHAGVRVRF